MSQQPEPRPNPDRYYLGGEEISLENPTEKEKFVQRLRQYLDVRNVSLLIGNGGSIPLGAPNLGDISLVRKEIVDLPHDAKPEGARAKALDLFDKLLLRGSRFGVEPFLGQLYHMISILEAGGSVTLTTADTEITIEAASRLAGLTKQWLYSRCACLPDQAHRDALRGHCELFRRLLLRPTKLPRTKVFTTNYDLVIERALDSLGVSYFDGFTGTIDRVLRPESYQYDLYFPGSTTEGKVSRVDRVLQLFKLHGSVNWRKVSEGRFHDISMRRETPAEADYGDVMIYPSPIKNSEMHGYPYSEMLRHFAAQIQQPQSILLVIGYSFADDHIRRIVYQALAIPSFALVIVVPELPASDLSDSSAPNSEIWRLVKAVSSKRVLVVTGSGSSKAGVPADGAGTLQGFATRWLPDIEELDIESRVAQEASLAMEPAQPPSKEKQNG